MMLPVLWGLPYPADSVRLAAAMGRVASQPSEFVVPALRKVREGQGTHLLDDASEIKNLGHRRTTRVMKLRQNMQHFSS